MPQNKIRQDLAFSLAYRAASFLDNFPLMRITSFVVELK